MASRSSWAGSPPAADRSRVTHSSVAEVLFIFDLLHVLFEVEHDHPAIAGADHPEEDLSFSLRELKAGLVGAAHVLQRLDRAVADLGDDVEICKAAGPSIAGEFHPLDVDPPGALEMKEGVGKLRDLLDGHVPLLALEVFAFLLPLRGGSEADRDQLG